jgi:hypothetical protein
MVHSRYDRKERLETMPHLTVGSRAMSLEVGWMTLADREGPHSG